MLAQVGRDASAAVRFAFCDTINAFLIQLLVAAFVATFFQPLIFQMELLWVKTLREQHGA